MHKALTQHLATLRHYLDVNAVAELLGVTPETVRRYCREDFIPHIKIATHLKFDPRLLAMWIQCHEFSAGGTLADKITDWVREHVVDRTLQLPVPHQISRIIAVLGANWLETARACAKSSTGCEQLNSLLEAFHIRLEAELSVAEQRDLFCNLLQLTEVHC